MSRLRLALLALGIVLVGIVVLGGGQHSRRGVFGFGLGRDSQGGDGPRAGGRGGVGTRSSDLSAAGVVRGHVLDQDGVAVGEGVLTLRCLEDDKVRRIPGGIIKIAADGSFEGPACRGQVCVSLTHPYEAPAGPWSLRAGVEAILNTQRLPRLHGHVQTAAGEAVPAATVSFVPDEGDDDPTAAIPMMTSSTRTDADGNFSAAWISRPPCGPCEEAEDRCHEPPVLRDVFAVVVNTALHPAGFAQIDTQAHAQAHAQARPGEDADDPLVITLPQVADLITGSLRGPLGQPYARAFVLARSLERRHEQRRGDVVDGVFEIDGLGEGRYALRALQDGVELAVGEGAPGDQVALTGQLGAGGTTLVVEVRNHNAEPQADAWVDGGPFRGARTDMKGQVRAAHVLSGRLVLRVRPPGHPAKRHILEVPTPTEKSPQIHEIVTVGTVPK